MIEELLRRHPRNVVRLILPRLVAEPMQTDDPNEHAARQLQRWTAQGVLRPDPEPGLYVYEYGDGDLTVCGIIGALELSEQTERSVLPHEDVIGDIVADRLAMMTAAQANLEPILLVYDGAGTTAELVEAARTGAPLIDVTEAPSRTPSSKRRHRLWAITDTGDVQRLQRLIAPHQALIADGHHRYAAYLELRRRSRRAGADAGPWDRGLALLIDSSQYPLHLGAIHRTVPDLDLAALTPPEGYVLGQMTSTGPPAAPASRTFVLTDGHSWRSLHAAAPSMDTVTDTELLHAVVLPEWQVPADEVRYHHTVEQAVRAASRDGGIAVLLHPPRLEQVMAVARTGTKLPRKSTSFGPKPRTGLVMRRFADGG